MDHRTFRRLSLALITAGALAACSPAPEDRTATGADDAAGLDEVAQQYVMLALSARRYDEAFVDAYFGPAAWDELASMDQQSLDSLRQAARDLRAALTAVPAESELASWRKAWLDANLLAMATRLDLVAGEQLPFDREAEGLFGVVPPRYEQPHFEALRTELDGLLPGSGGVRERYLAYRERFVIPPERLDEVFRTAMAECRARTAGVMELPEGESFTIEYVMDKPWSGYNWYQGGARSLIQVNTDLPIYIDRAVDLACHEGYPGHHTLNALIEQRLVGELGLVEFSLYPLFSPLSLIAEGTANYGIEIAFPGTQRQVYEREALFPLAGLDEAEADRYYRVQALVRQLNYANNEAARGYLDGEWSREQALAFLRDYLLYSDERAEQRLRFIETYRSYVINYNFGRDLAESWVLAQAGIRSDEAWQVFTELLAQPPLTRELAGYHPSPEAVALARDALILDLHVDVPYRLVDEIEAGAGFIDFSERTSEGDFDIPRARDGGLDAPFMSIYVPAELEAEGGSYETANHLIDLVERMVSADPDVFRIATSPDELEAAVAQGYIALPLGMENGSPVEGDLEKFHALVDRGIRYITLAHSLSNHISDSSYDEARPNGGLSDFGRELVAAMNDRGVMVDVSHISDEALREVLELSRAPVIASHSSARSFTPDWERNLPDELIVAIAEAGGVVHINYGSSFLTPHTNAWSQAYWDARDLEEARLIELHGEGEEAAAALAEWAAAYRAADPYPYADLSDVLDHIDHVVALAGVAAVGLGSDYDGVGNSLPVGLKDVASYPLLVQGLMDRGYDEADIRAILGGNSMRVWREVGAAAR